MLSLCGKKLLTTLLLDYRKIAYQVDHGTWSEKTGYDFPALPRQTRGNDCGVFVLMYTLSMVCGIGFQLQEMDIPIIRQWWCLLLMERFQIDGLHNGSWFSLTPFHSCLLWAQICFLD
ncbi:uncharacterized protein isoform X3 [Danio rerio]|uniref:Uncharacterized protein isoform X3 n=1 Tax=Danio rerio TaxID=7955 RepID=A0AC58JC49_DANRE